MRGVGHRDALDALDRQGWQRSFHQRLFHDNFIRACARIFWKTEPPGSFARDHQKILEINGWDHLSQEILVSTPRRCTGSTSLKSLLLKVGDHALACRAVSLASLADENLAERAIQAPLCCRRHQCAIACEHLLHRLPLATHAAAVLFGQLTAAVALPKVGPLLRLQPAH